MSTEARIVRTFSPAKSVKQILKAIDCPYLDLAKGVGYWYFIYDRIQDGVYDTKSVYVSRLNDLSVTSWVLDGKGLVEKCEQQLKNRLDPNYRNMSMIYKNME